ncbi:hypothetical protein EDC01DRAFT_646247 [Geopyxis carbonaria]|nr:hypothetical protein EDC01DRAFT_646247 [Geopyxis carbonaria]
MADQTYLKLKPAFTFKAEVELPRPIGVLSTGSQKLFINIKALSLVSAPGYSPALEAHTLIAAGDWATTDPSGKFARLDVRAVAATADGEHVNFEYVGIITMTEAIGKVLSGAADAVTTRWGDLVVTPRFETSERYKELESKVWVASGRFIVGEKGERMVEYRVSEVVGCQE